MASLSDLSPKALRRAAQLKESIQKLQNELARLLGGNSGATSVPASKPKKGRRKKRTMSPEGRAKIAEAQRRRWAKAKRA